MIKETISYYNKNAEKLLCNYDKANMDKTYKFISKYLKKDSQILDVGFGSGRDIRYFKSKNISIFGIEGSKEFLSIFKKRYPQLCKNVFYSELPNINLSTKFNKYFDLIFSMATLMHIPKEDHLLTINNIKKILKENGILILAYSCNERKNDPRFFERLTPKYIEELLLDNNFILIDNIISEDGLLRNEIEWVTQAFKYIGKG